MTEHSTYYMTIDIEELIVACMILKEKTEITIEDVFNLCMKTYEKMRKEKINGSVLYSNVYLKEFERKHSEDFYVGENVISLKNGHDIDWLIKNFTSYMSLAKLEFLNLTCLESSNEINDFI